MEQSVKQGKSWWTGLMLGGTCAFFVLGNTGAAFAQQASAPKPAVMPARVAAAQPAGEEEEATTPDKPGAQGIKIHGHWVMDIKNPDGTLVKHLDFQNSLTTGGGTVGGIGTAYSTGDQILAALLSGTGVISDPGIVFGGFVPASATLPPNTDISNICGFSICGVLTTPQSTLSFSPLPGESSAQQTGLVAKVNFTPVVSWVLSGNFTVPSGMTSLTVVQTYLPLCVANVNTLASVTIGGSSVPVPHLVGSTTDRSAAAATMNNCSALGFSTSNLYPAYGPLTSTIVQGAPQTITPGQVITVTVTITFS